MQKRNIGIILTMLFFIVVGGVVGILLLTKSSPPQIINCSTNPTECPKGCVLLNVLTYKHIPHLNYLSL